MTWSSTPNEVVSDVMLDCKLVPALLLSVFQVEPEELLSVQSLSQVMLEESAGPKRPLEMLAVWHI